MDGSGKMEGSETVGHLGPPEGDLGDDDDDDDDDDEDEGSAEIFSESLRRDSSCSLARRESSACTRFWMCSSRSLERVESVCGRLVVRFGLADGSGREGVYGCLWESGVRGMRTSELFCRASMISWEKRTGVSLRRRSVREVS